MKQLCKIPPYPWKPQQRKESLQDCSLHLMVWVVSRYMIIVLQSSSGIECVSAWGYKFWGLFSCLSRMGRNEKRQKETQKQGVNSAPLGIFVRIGFFQRSYSILTMSFGLNRIFCFVSSKWGVIRFMRKKQKSWMQ